MSSPKQTEQKTDLLEWLITNMIAIENDTLDEDKRKLFIELVEKQKENEFFQQAFEEFEKRKLNKIK